MNVRRKLSHLLLQRRSSKIHSREDTPPPLPPSLNKNALPIAPLPPSRTRVDSQIPHVGRFQNPPRRFLDRESSAGVLGLLLGIFLVRMGMDSNTIQDPPTEASESTELVEYPPVTCSRIKLRDGRVLAYTERGVPKNRSNYKIIIVHGFGSSKEMSFPVSRELIEKLGIYIVLYDRAGYGDSDMNSNRTVKSEALDIQELAERLQLGSKFYVIGVSMGSYPTWSCLKYIPDRLAGVALVVPTVNYRWPSLPESLTKPDYRKRLIRWSLRIASHAPGLLQWWVTQKWHPSDGDPTLFNQRDIEVLKTTPGFPMFTPENLRRRKVFETLRSDFKVGFGKWEFDPMDLSDPFPKGGSSVHIWQGCEDKVVPFQLQRFVSRKLPWIKYHEIPDGGHLLVHYNGVCDAIVKALLIGEEPVS
ncbi:hypothetical protein EUGRSUZ_J00487 [Eucalyptus grandis]|uniref:Uncharacterized protein n=3 Tax=Eucalyptus grandis TaxID=71139 RepID=A0ACC3J2J1_EUCGR|nr:hypothetical protein EUGRSUZ_J00487 [Eucalyptus grandis]